MFRNLLRLLLIFFVTCKYYLVFADIETNTNEAILSKVSKDMKVLFCWADPVVECQFPGRNQYWWTVPHQVRIFKAISWRYQKVPSKISICCKGTPHRVSDCHVFLFRKPMYANQLRGCVNEKVFQTLIKILVFATTLLYVLVRSRVFQLKQQLNTLGLLIDRWVPTGDGVSCQAPVDYAGNCKKIVDFSGFTPLQKSFFAASCKSPWPCDVGCLEDFDMPCPIGWTVYADGSCSAPTSYYAGCVRTVDLRKLTPEYRRLWREICSVQW